MDRSGVQIAPYATDPAGSRRVYVEPIDALRGPFELDRHRIVECAAFRRLEGKTQVFSPSRNDHFRTRLTHTLEVSHIARSLARALLANEALAEAITLAHDLGHPPFGHAGEAALNEVMAGAGGFNHNGHSVRVVEYLEHPFPAFRGLNLTLDTLAGLRLHETKYDVPAAGRALEADDAGTSRSSRYDVGSHISPDPEGKVRPQTSPPLQVGDRGAVSRQAEAPRPAGPSVEAQIASVADRIAYDTHDLEDAIGAGFVTLEALSGVELWRRAFERVASSGAVGSIYAVRRVVLDAALNDVLSDVVVASKARLTGVTSPQGVGPDAVAMSDEMERVLKSFEAFLGANVYGHAEVAAMDATGKERVTALFDTLRARPELLPSRFATRIDDQGADRVICDYIAGMTDRFCTSEYERHVGRR